MPYFVYILECADGTFYTGSTTDIVRRIREHNDSKKGACYTKTRRPVVLKYTEKCKTRSDALKREIEIKSLERKKKENLWKDLES